MKHMARLAAPALIAAREHKMENEEQGEYTARLSAFSRLAAM